jgi:hypothetical protein
MDGHSGTTILTFSRLASKLAKRAEMTQNKFFCKKFISVSKKLNILPISNQLT